MTSWEDPEQLCRQFITCWEAQSTYVDSQSPVEKDQSRYIDSQSPVEEARSGYVDCQSPVQKS